MDYIGKKLFFKKQDECNVLGINVSSSRWEWLLRLRALAFDVSVLPYERGVTAQITSALGVLTTRSTAVKVTAQLSPFC